MRSARYTIEDLDPTHHQIQSFSCGVPQLDNALHDPVRLPGFGRTYVVVSHPGSAEILACYTLCPRETFPPPNQFVFIQLNILAVNQLYQKRRIGRWVLSQIIHDMVQWAKTEQLDYLLVAPLNESSEFYLKLGFKRLPKGGDLILPVKTMPDLPWLDNNE